MPKLLIVGDDYHNIRERIMQMVPDIEPITTAPEESVLSGVYPHVITIENTSIDGVCDYFPEPKKGIGNKAQWANKPHKRKGK